MCLPTRLNPFMRTIIDAETASVAEWGVTFLDWSVKARMMRLVRLVRLAKVKQMLDFERKPHANDLDRLRAMVRGSWRRLLLSIAWLVGLIDTVYTLVKRLEITKLEVAFYFRVSFLLILNLAAAHFLGCLWLMIGRHNVLNQQNPSGWLAGAYEQDTPEKTKDFVSCSGDGFDAARWK